MDRKLELLELAVIRNQDQSRSRTRARQLKSGTLGRRVPLQMSKTLELRVHRSELTYEVAVAPSFDAAIDTPGKVVSALLSELDHLGVNLSDISLDDGPLEDQGLSCNVDKFNANILLRVDRFEVRFFANNETEDAAAEVARGLWQALATVSAEIAAKSHSLLFEMDCELAAGSYGAAVRNFCRPHEGLPEGTETAIVYYLPQDSSQGFLDSSVVLNRSAEIDGGILVAATLVFEGKRFGRDGAVQAGRERLNELLTSLNVTLEAGS
jgi:hypothetical protein